jgi:hypothetical protein
MFPVHTKIQYIGGCPVKIIFPSDYLYHLRIFKNPYHCETVLYTNDKSLAIQSFKSIRRNKPVLKPFLFEGFNCIFS